ncbi:hypothetical protein OV450_1383 [Actinobacteria bacterium OV450]|nr:hypothetical protein OV450_1383 [Actinobacteria bacterium OV450]
MGIIDTRVCIDDTLGPLDCKLDPTNRWNGWLSPRFTLGATRALSAQTLGLADECGYDSVDTIHVIDGRVDSAETVHVIDGGTWDGEPLAAAVRINWRKLARGAADATTITRANAKDRKAARKPGGRGARLSVVVHIRWMYFAEESSTAANIVEPRDGLYSIGGWEWTWSFASWWCPCGNGQDWHELDCECGLTRETHITDPTPAKVTASEIATTLRALVPGATAALVDLDVPRVFGVFASGALLDTTDDTGPFDAESLGEVDTALREAMRFTSLGELTATWDHLPHETYSKVYRIPFPAPLQ